MEQYPMLFDAAKFYGKILAAEVLVTRKDSIIKLIENKINRGPWVFFSIIKTRREYQHVKINELVENERSFTELEKKVMWDGIIESLQSSSIKIENRNPSLAEKKIKKQLCKNTSPHPIGKGGFGIVEQVKLQDGSFVARKTLQLTGEENRDKDLKRRFKREVEYQSSFEHSNIVQVIDSDLEGHPPSFMMPLASCHLGGEGKTGLSFDFDTKVKAFLDTLNGLEVLHKKGHTHRDIKPGNILRFDYADKRFEYKVSDFGLISPVDRDNTTNITSTWDAYGTQQYMPRECFMNGFRVANAQSDIYSLGVLLLFLFKESGENLGVPYDERTSAGVFGDIISKCTKKEQNERYESIAQLRTAFNSVIGEK